MAKNKGWWELKIIDNINESLTYTDLEQISILIKQGYCSGEIPDNEKWFEDEIAQKEVKKK